MNLVAKIAELVESNIEFQISKGVMMFSKKNKNITLTSLPVGYSYSVDNESIYIINDTKLNNNFKKVFYKKISNTYISLIKGAIIGLNTGYSKTLNLIGSGYKSSFDLNKRVLNLLVGYSHPISVVIPIEVKIELESNGTLIKLSGHNKQVVTQTAGIIYNSKKRNIYKGTGIYYFGKPIRTKEIKKK